MAPTAGPGILAPGHPPPLSAVGARTLVVLQMVPGLLYLYPVAALAVFLVNLAAATQTSVSVSPDAFVLFTRSEPACDIVVGADFADMFRLQILRV